MVLYIKKENERDLNDEKVTHREQESINEEM